MKSWSELFKKKTSWGVLAFLVLIVFLAAKTADAAETSIELAPGTAFVAGERYDGGLLLIEERFKSKYAVGVGLTTVLNCSGDCKRGDSPSNGFVFAQRVFEYKSFEAGVGFSYWHNQTPAWNSNTPFALHLGYDFTDHFTLRYRHFSTAGSSSQNGGLDVLAVVWRF